MRMVVAGALLIAGTSGAGAQGFPKEAPAYYIECLRQRSSLIDDGVSDARTIASVTVPYCFKRQADYLAALNASKVLIDLHRAPPRDSDIADGVEVVLQLRAKKRTR